jgi:hypothetical protein
MLFAEKCLELEIIMLSKISKMQKDECYIFLSYVEKERERERERLEEGLLGNWRDIRAKEKGRIKEGNMGVGTFKIYVCMRSSQWNLLLNN